MEPIFVNDTARAEQVLKEHGIVVKRRSMVRYTDPQTLICTAAAMTAIIIIVLCL